MSVRCPNGDHKGPIQDFSEVCLACGHNIYETDAEYERQLDQELEQQRSETGKQRIARKEETLRQTAPTPKCPHRNVQQYSEFCLDCNKNIYS